MAYKIFISTNDTQACQQYLRAAKAALYSVDEFPATAITMSDFPMNEESPLEYARAIIAQSDMFIGIYGAQYGQVPAGETQSFAEQEYQYAYSLGKPCMLYAQASAMDTTDERQRAFFQHVQQHHILNKFTDETELRARLKLAVDAYRQNMQAQQRKLQPPMPTLRPQTIPLERDNFEMLVSQAVTIAESQLESIMRRSLELHDATKRVQESDLDGLLNVRPIFGEPLRRSQFQADVFMIMPFRDHFNGIYQQIIQPTVQSLNLTIKRGDDFSSTRGAIMQEVWAAINACRLVIVETTEINANVYYELGIAHTLGKPAILLTQTTSVDELPFDIRHLRFLVYANTADGGQKLEVDLRHTILWLLNDLEEANNSQSG